MGRFVDLTGQHFGRLTVIERVGIYRWKSNPKRTEPLWRCLCDPELGGCGTEFLAMGNNLRSGKTRSCGCLRAEKSAERLQNMQRRKRV